MVPVHCVAPGVQTGAAPHEQAPHVPLEVHVCVPYVLQACVWLGAHEPVHTPEMHVWLVHDEHVAPDVPQEAVFSAA